MTAPRLARQAHPETAALLHNMGGPPSATISWRGLGQSVSAASVSLPRDVGHTSPTWLQLNLSIGQASPCYRRDWNTASALLGIVEPEHGLGEAAAQARLIAVIEAEAARCRWPARLLATPGVWDSRQENGPCVQVEHATATLMAMAKCTGSLWQRDRQPHLAALQSPSRFEPSSVPLRAVRWSQRLWFAQGIPPDLLTDLRTTASLTATD